MSLISFKEFRDKTLNKEIAVPWGYPGQCVSLVQIGNKDMYDLPLKARGNAKDYGRNIVNSGYGRYVDSPRYGDIIVWGSDVGGGYGHIAYYVDSKTIYDQNNSSVKPTTHAKLRPMLKNKPIAYVRMNTPLKPDIELLPKGRFYFNNATPIKVRDGRNGLAGKDTGARYTKGHTVRYDGVYEKDGFTWLTYISATGVRRSVAVGDKNGLWGYNI